MGVGENIRSARQRANLTQKQLGALCGIAEPTIRRYELNKLNPKFDTIAKITLHAIARNGFGNAKLRYFAAVSIEAPRYIGSLYDAILQNYKNLTPIEIRNVNRIMVDR